VNTKKEGEIMGKLRNPNSFRIYINYILWGFVLAFLAYLTVQSLPGCATLGKLPQGVSFQLSPDEFKGVVNVPNEWPDLTKYEFLYERVDLDDEMKNIGFLHYMDYENMIDYVFTVLIEEGEVFAGEIIHKMGLFHLYWIYEDNIPHSDSCSENELMAHIEKILENERAKNEKHGI